MNILLIGSHGKVGQLLLKHLALDGHSVRAMHRNPEQKDLLKKPGGQPYLADLEKDFSKAFNEINTVIFTAGSGGHTGPDKTIDIDQNAAIRSMKIAKQFGIKHYIMVSAQGTREPELPSKIQHYYKAKRKADDYLVQSGLTYTIYRPGRLLDQAATGKIKLSTGQLERGTTIRENLALTISKGLKFASLQNKLVEVVDGEKEIIDAIETL